MLYHVPKLEQAIAECARVLRPGGRLVAATHSVENVSELWDLIGCEEPRTPAELRPLERHGRCSGATSPRWSSATSRRSSSSPTRRRSATFVASTIDRAHYAAQVPEINEPFRATTRHTVFIAEK